MIPNLLTVSRIALAPCFIALFTTRMWFGALIVAILFEVTDILDGHIARRTGRVSDLGKFMDPIADSIARFTTFLCFLSIGYAPIWAVAVMFWRDSVVAGLRILGATQGVVISARWSGKLKAICQGTAIITILCFMVWPDIFGVGAERVPDLARTLLWIIAGITLASLFEYLWGNRRILATLRRRPA